MTYDEFEKWKVGRKEYMRAIAQREGRKYIPIKAGIDEQELERRKKISEGDEKI